MKQVVNLLMTNCRSNIYLFIGFFLGFSISVFFLPINFTVCERNSKNFLTYNLTLSNSNGETVNKYLPNIDVAARLHKQPKIAPKLFVRPRYYSTELGIREKLFVGVFTSPEHLHSRAIAINKTVAHLVDKLRYFISIAEKTKPNVSLPGIVGFTDTRTILQPFHSLKYITDNYLEDYDYFFLVKDTSFINARRLNDLINKISISHDVHLGIVNDHKKYCSLDSGILLSNSLMKKIRKNLDYCVKITFSSSDDVNFGRCILHSTSIPCKHTVNEQYFSSTKLNATFNYQNDFEKLITYKNLETSITIFPIYDFSFIYKINKHFSQIELVKIEKKKNKLRYEILNTTNFTLVSNDVTWPIGSQPEFKTVNRFDVIQWTYFNMTHSFLDDDFKIVKKLKFNQKKEICKIIKASNKFLQNSRQKIKFISLKNGYWKFDNSRGIDYLLDFSITTDEGIEFSKRIQVCKSLGKVEILPAPYVTENSRINMIVTVDSLNIKEALAFLAHYADVCMDRKDRVSLTIVLLYDPGYTSKGKVDVFNEIKLRTLFLTQKYKKDQLKVSWLSIKLPKISNFLEIEPLLKIAIADLYIKKLTLDNLLLFADIRMEIKVEFLNRVRMNTISQWQVFSPIPFVQYHPDVINYNKNPYTKFDIIHSHGRYDEYNYDFVAFYAKDYLTVRKSFESQVPFVQIDKNIASTLKLSRNISIGSIFEMFILFGKLNTFRTVEPALKLRHKDASCIGTRNKYTLDNCLKNKSLQLGNRGQLARLILDYQEQ